MINYVIPTTVLIKAVAIDDNSTLTRSELECLGANLSHKSGLYGSALRGFSLVFYLTPGRMRKIFFTDFIVFTTVLNSLRVLLRIEEAQD